MPAGRPCTFHVNLWPPEAILNFPRLSTSCPKVLNMLTLTSELAADWKLIVISETAGLGNTENDTFSPGFSVYPTASADLVRQAPRPCVPILTVLSPL